MNENSNNEKKHRRLKPDINPTAERLKPDINPTADNIRLMQLFSRYPADAGY